MGNKAEPYLVFTVTILQAWIMTLSSQPQIQILSCTFSRNHNGDGQCYKIRSFRLYTVSQVSYIHAWRPGKDGNLSQRKVGI